MGKRKIIKIINNSTPLSHDYSEIKKKIDIDGFDKSVYSKMNKKPRYLVPILGSVIIMAVVAILTPSLIVLSKPNLPPDKPDGLSGSRYYPDGIKTHTFTALFNYQHIMKDNELIASLLFDNSTLNEGFESLKSPGFHLVAGDRLAITYTGELITRKSNPCQTYILNGELKEYTYWQTYLIVADNITSEELKKTYVLKTNNIILDEANHFKSIDEYTGTTFYLSIDNSSCPVGYSCSPESPLIEAIYAYYPRL